jgi:carboxylesterase type B
LRLDYTAAATYWSNFAKTVDPNGSGLPQWPSYDPASHNTMELEDHVGPIPEAEPAKVEFFRGYFKK